MSQRAVGSFRLSLEFLFIDNFTFTSYRKGPMELETWVREHTLSGFRSLKDEFVIMINILHDGTIMHLHFLTLEMSSTKSSLRMALFANNEPFLPFIPHDILSTTIAWDILPTDLKRGIKTIHSVPSSMVSDIHLRDIFDPI